MHNLKDEDWKIKKLSIMTWEADVESFPEQKLIRSVLERNANATFGDNCYIAPDCNFFTDTAELGKNVRIASQVTLRGNIVMGNDVSVNPMTNIVGNVRIGDAVRIASSVQIFGFNHGFLRVDRLIKDQNITSDGIDIGSGTWIGAGVSIVDGVNIGEHCIVAAGATVTKSFPSFSIIGGTPAKILKCRLKDGDLPIKINNIARKDDCLEYCVDLPKTGVIDSNHNSVNAWIASTFSIDNLRLESEISTQNITEFHKRPDVASYLESCNIKLFEKGHVIGFRIKNVQKNSILIADLDGISKQLFCFI